MAIKSCPFCGHSGIEFVQEFQSGSWNAFRCENCEAQGPGGADAVKALESWNTRVGDEDAK